MFQTFGLFLETKRFPEMGDEPYFWVRRGECGRMILLPATADGGVGTTAI
jgi:hypothetical protein